MFPKFTMNSVDVSCEHFEFTIYFADSLWIQYRLGEILWIHYQFHEFTINFGEFFWCFANILWIHCLNRESSKNSRDVRILFEFNWFSANKLWIHFIFREFTINLLPFSRIHYLFREFTLDLLSFVRIYNEFTIFFTILLWTPYIRELT